MTSGAHRIVRTARLAAAGLALALAATACADGGPGADNRLTIYSGRSQELVGPLIDAFEQATAIRVEVRYGETAELAATILEEGPRSPAQVFFAQDAGALGALAAHERLQPLDPGVLERVPASFRSPDGVWVGVSGRARVAVYNTDRIDPTALPTSILGFGEPAWRGRVGWAPTNASFQANVTALRVLLGDETARDWLAAMRENAVGYERNTAIVEAVASGEVDIGLTNHYYLVRMKVERPRLPAENHFLSGGDAGALINIAGVAILDSAGDAPAARRFVAFLLEEAAQRHFADETFEYPLVAGVPADPGLPPLQALEPPSIDLTSLADLEGTLRMLQDTGVL